jgi:hypothetical protein
MDEHDLCQERCGRPAFDEVSPALRRCVHGVDYVLVRDGDGGEFYFTRDGWAVAESLLPRHWYQDQRFFRVGRALPGATGSVYRVPVPHAARGSVGIVVKFCRFGQDVGLTTLGAGSVFPWPEELLAEAEFLGPFEEFGAIHRLRERARREPRIATKRPLAIHVPAARHSGWRLGRADYRLDRQVRALDADQARRSPGERIHYDPERVYVLLYSWVEGIDAEQAAQCGLISTETMMELGREAAEAVAAHGFAVLDHKPRHVIVRPLGAGGLLRRRGRTAFALIDYELLVPWAGPVAPVRDTSLRLPNNHD